MWYMDYSVTILGIEKEHSKKLGRIGKIKSRIRRTARTCEEEDVTGKKTSSKVSCLFFIQLQTMAYICR